MIEYCTHSTMTATDQARIVTGEQLPEPSGQPPTEATAPRGSGDSDRSALLADQFVRVRSILSHLDSLRMEYVYLAVALIWGVALVVVMPPFQVPDEPAHFYRAWGLAQGQILPPRDFKEALPENVWALQAAFPIGSIGDPAPYPNYSPSKVADLLGERISSHTVHPVSAIPSQNPLAYVPQAFGVEIARLTGFSPLGSFYLARLFNLLAAVALVFFAIRMAPFGKVMLLIVALFPVTISEMASTSPDALMISGAFFFTGLMLNLSDRTTTRDRQMVAVLAAAALLLAIKPGYFPLVALLFLLRPRCFPSARRYVAWMSGIIGVVLVVAALMVFTAPKAPADLTAVLGPAAPGADAVAQMRHVFSDPFGFVAVVLRTFGASGITYGYWMVGLLGWLTIYVSQTAVLLMLFLIVCFIGGFEGEPLVGLRRRWVLLLTWAATMASVCLAIYAGLNVVGGATVLGIQGRYLTPMLPLLLLGVYRLQLNRRSAAVIILVVVLAVVAMTTMRAVWYHYY